MRSATSCSLFHRGIADQWAELSELHLASSDAVHARSFWATSNNDTLAGHACHNGGRVPRTPVCRARSAAQRTWYREGLRGEECTAVGAWLKVY